jgi:hypothetical protein
MTLPTIDQARSWRGLTLVATDNEPVGRIEAIYVDRTTRQPEWALVHTGLFGSSRTFVPLADAAQRGDTVKVPTSRRWSARPPGWSRTPSCPRRESHRRR